MPISGDQCMDKNDPDYSLPMDSVVGSGGPEPTEVTTISGATGAKTSYSAVNVPVGYDGP